MLNKVIVFFLLLLLYQFSSLAQGKERPDREAEADYSVTEMVDPPEDSRNHWKKLNGPVGAVVSGLFVKGDTVIIGTGYSHAFIFFSFDAGNTWTQADIRLSRRINEFYFGNDNSIMATCANNGIYKSFDFNIWTNIFNTTEDFWSIGEDAYGNIYASTNNRKLYKSNNSGINWNLELGNLIDRPQTFASSPDSILYVGLHGRILKKNKTSSWEVINMNLQTTYHPYYYDYLYVHTGGSISKSGDNGISWEQLDIYNFFQSNWIYDLSKSGSRMIAACSDETGWFGNGWGIALSDDEGLTWRWQSTGLPPKFSSAIKLAKAGNNTYLSTNAAGVFKSSNDGDSWFPVNNGITAANVLDIIISNDSTLYAASWSNFLQRSIDKGETWQTMSNGFTNSYFYSIIEDTSGTLIAGTDQGIFRSTNKGTSWQQTATAGNNYSYRLHKDRQNRIYSMNYGNGIYRTSNKGNSWTRIDNGFFSNFVFGFAIDSSNNIYAGTRGGGIYKSTNDGATWVLLRSSSINNCVVTRIVVAPNGHIFATNTEEGVLRSTDNGATWTVLTNGLSSLRVSPLAINSKGQLYVGTKTDQLYTSTDNGETWVDISHNLIQTAVQHIIFDKEDNIYLATDQSVWKSNPDFIPVELTNFTASVSGNSIDLKWGTATETNNKGFEIERKQEQGEWESITFIPGNGTTTEPKEYTYADNNLSPGSYKYKLIQIDYDSTRKEEKEIEVEINIIPFEYALYQNYPNPFNPTTTIKYSVKEAGIVSLKVYDILGKEIATLVNEIKTPGEYTTTFDASLLSSGIYFYTMQAVGFSATNKFLLLK
jgi:photosystem II stability/assembly factor-like uncharacterized protein